MDEDNILISCLLVNNINFFIELLIISCNRSFSMDPLTINLYHGGKFLEKMAYGHTSRTYWGTWIFIGWICFRIMSLKKM